MSLALSSSGAGLVPTKYWKKGGGASDSRRMRRRLVGGGVGSVKGRECLGPPARGPFTNLFFFFGGGGRGAGG